VVGDFRTFEKISLVVVMSSVNLWKPPKVVVGGATYRFDLKVAVCDFSGKSQTLVLAAVQLTVSSSLFNNFSPAFSNLLHRHEPVL